MAMVPAVQMVTLVQGPVDSTRVCCSSNLTNVASHGLRACLYKVPDPCPCSAQEEEFYCITWEAKKEVVFELPTGGAAIMRQVGDVILTPLAGCSLCADW
jgi:PsaD